MRPHVIIALLATLTVSCAQESAPLQVTSTQAASPLTTNAAPTEAQPAVRWQEGIHYERIDPPQSTHSGPGKIEVIEFFGYWCPHCARLEPLLEYWEVRAPDDVVLIRVPVTWGKENLRSYARFFYTLQQLNRTDLHDVFFEAVERAKRSGKPVPETFEAQQAFAAEHGISAQTFANIYNSDAVSAAVDRAEKLARDYKVQGTPSMTVQGRYRTNSGKADGLSELVLLVDELVAKEDVR